MKRNILVLVVFGACSSVAMAQVGGNIGYSQQAGGSAKMEQNERNKRVLTHDELPPSGTSFFVEANVLMNVKADEYVAVFALAQEGTTPTECSQKMDATIHQFAEELKALGIGRNDFFVDFAAQNKIYSFEVTGEVAKERLSGFELKKNIAIHYKDKALLDRLVLAASHSQIFDLIKVDYIVTNPLAVQNKLMAEAAKVLKQKTTRHEQLLGIKLQKSPQIYAEKPSIYYPTEQYDSYSAYETEDISAGYYRQKYVIQSVRKSRTFFFNPLNAKNFDTVINPVVIEPVVQFTLYLKVKYELENPKTAEPTKKPALKRH
ncbi:SIMPL domain-containing protein [Armatimonas sp.]|uniref:SIMPL domain-containing protein n=1 Tax=Armatimonas sp. TaxID=1872638 RepID=UPI0037502A6B